ncbi:hypothetical protein [Pseudolactococcus yaeyamensis]
MVIPLRANVNAKAPSETYYLTPFKTDNPHFKNPGLDFQKAVFLDLADETMFSYIDPPIPSNQLSFIKNNLNDLELKFETFVLSIEDYPQNSRMYRFSTVPFFPEGIQKIKDLQNARLNLVLQEGEPTWRKIVQNAPEWFDAAYETDTNDDYPAKTFPIDFDMFMDDFEEKNIPLDDNLPLTDRQKIELQKTYAFYDNDNKFHPFQEVLESVGGSIPENMPIVQDDRLNEAPFGYQVIDLQGEDFMDYATGESLGFIRDIRWSDYLNGAEDETLTHEVIPDWFDKAFIEEHWDIKIQALTREDTIELGIHDFELDGEMAELKKIEEKTMKDNKSFNHTKANAEWRAQEIKIKEGADVFQEQNFEDFGENALLVHNLNQINEKLASLYTWGKNLMAVVNKETKGIELVIRQKSDKNPLKIYDNDTVIPARLVMFDDEIDMTEQDKGFLLKRGIDFEAVKKVFSEVGVSKDLHYQFNDFTLYVNVKKAVARELMISAAVAPKNFVQCIDDNMIAAVHYQSGDNRSLSSADFSDGFNNFYRFINDDDLIKNILESKLSNEIIQLLFKKAEIDDLTDYEGLADYLNNNLEQMLKDVKDAYIEATGQFGIVFNQTTSSYQLEAGDVEKYCNKQLKDFEQEMKLKTGTLVDNYSFENGSFDEVLSLDKAELPYINEEASIDVAEYVTYAETGEFIFFNAYQIDFAGNPNVLNCYELEQVAQAAYDAFEELDISFEPEEDLPDIIEEHSSFFSQELEEQGIGADKIDQLINSDLVKNLDSLVNSNVFEGVLHPTKSKSM